MKIDILGNGNVATHLFRALSNKADVCKINSRTLDNLRTDSDIYIISVTDNAIAKMSNRIYNLISNKSIVVHTSGSISLDTLEKRLSHKGVLYPLQTFTKDVSLNYNEIPFFIEASDQFTEDILYQVASLISNKIKMADSITRRDIHIASVLACNFVNHLWVLAEYYLNSKNIDFNDLIPLIKETAKKIERIKPDKAQTGPAIRNDLNVINAHLESLNEYKDIADIYKMLSESIIKYHTKC